MNNHDLPLFRFFCSDLPPLLIDPLKEAVPVSSVASTTEDVVNMKKANVFSLFGSKGNIGAVVPAIVLKEKKESKGSDNMLVKMKDKLFQARRESKPINDIQAIVETLVETPLVSSANEDPDPFRSIDV
jgi:hypothetical protein